MAKSYFDLSTVHSSWQPCLSQALQAMDLHYLEKLAATQNWLPGPQKIFSAFSLPLGEVNYLLLGESPYPRVASANGYAFWDAQVGEIWSPEGMTKKVNRATSLRNLIKMLLVAEGLLKPPHLGQPEISQLDKNGLVQTNAELFGNLLSKGFLLLNATPVLQSTPVAQDARAWQPFLKQIILCLTQARPEVKFILFGKLANAIDKLLPAADIDKLCVEHPYNHSFVANPEVLRFFRPLRLLKSNDSGNR